VKTENEKHLADSDREVRGKEPKHTTARMPVVIYNTLNTLWGEILENKTTSNKIGASLISRPVREQILNFATIQRANPKFLTGGIKSTLA
jgi:hypothetical protein